MANLGLVAQLEKKKAKKRVLCGGKTYAPFGMKVGGPPPAVYKVYRPRNFGKLPQKVDLRKFMSPVEDQSETNSCCANAMAGAFEYYNMRHCNATGDTPADISRMFIYYVGRKWDQKNYGEDEKEPLKDGGMTVGSTITAMQTYGACLETDWPYSLDSVNKKPTDECFKKAQQFKVLEATQVPLDLDLMRRCLADGHPILFGLQLTQRFFYATNGFCPTPDSSDAPAFSHGLHAMLFVGYNDRKSVFIVRNSWGTDWGDEGYGYIPYDYATNMDFNCAQMYAIKSLTEADFTPDDDDGDDSGIPTYAGDADLADCLEFDANDEPEEEEDVLELATDMVEIAKMSFSGRGGTVPKFIFKQTGMLLTRMDMHFSDWLDRKLQEYPEEKEYTFDDMMAFFNEYGVDCSGM